MRMDAVTSEAGSARSLCSVAVTSRQVRPHGSTSSTPKENGSLSPDPPPVVGSVAGTSSLVALAPPPTSPPGAGPKPTKTAKPAAASTARTNTPPSSSLSFIPVPPAAALRRRNRCGDGDRRRSALRVFRRDSRLAARLGSRLVAVQPEDVLEDDRVSVAGDVLVVDEVLGVAEVPAERELPDEGDGLEEGRVLRVGVAAELALGLRHHLRPDVLVVDRLGLVLVEDLIQHVVGREPIELGLALERAVFDERLDLADHRLGKSNRALDHAFTRRSHRYYPFVRLLERVRERRGYRAPRRGPRQAARSPDVLDLYLRTRKTAIMTPYEAFDRDVEVNGRTVLSVVEEGMGRFSDAYRERAIDALAAEGSAIRPRRS